MRLTIRAACSSTWGERALLMLLEKEPCRWCTDNFPVYYFRILNQHPSYISVCFLGTLRGVSCRYRRYPKCFNFVRTHAGDAWSSHLNLNITSFRGRKSQSILYHNMVLGMSLLYKESDNIWGQVVNLADAAKISVQRLELTFVFFCSIWQ